MRKVSRKITPAPLTSKTKTDLYNENVVIVGWGLTINNEVFETPTRYLQEAKVKALPNKVCEDISYNIFKEKAAIADKYLCTKAEPYALLSNVRNFFCHCCLH